MGPFKDWTLTPSRIGVGPCPFGPFGDRTLSGVGPFLLRDLTSSGSGLLKALPFKGWPASKIGIGLLPLEGLDPWWVPSRIGPLPLFGLALDLAPSGPFGDRTLSGVGPFPPQGFDFFREWTS